jgi:hypothetical protein
VAMFMLKGAPEGQLAFDSTDAIAREFQVSEREVV